MKKLIVLCILTLIISIQTTSADIISDAVYYSREMYINKTGKKVPEKQAEAIYQSYFKKQAQNERSIVRFYDNNGKIGYRDEKGNTIIEPQFREGDWNFRNGTAAVRTKDDKWGIINEKGNWVIEPKYDLVLNFSEGLAGAVKDNKLGFIDKNENWVIKPQFFSALCYVNRGNLYFQIRRCNTTSEFHEGLAPVELDKGKFGYINKEGKIAFKFKGYYPCSFSEGLACIDFGDDSYGYIDKTGKTVIPPKYVTASNFHNGIAFVRVRNFEAEKRGKEERLKKHKEWLQEQKNEPKKEIKQQENAKSELKNTNVAYADINYDTKQKNKMETAKTNILYASLIFLIWLIFLAFRSIRREIKRNNDDKQN